MATTIFYFTGTGNSLKIAGDLAGLLGDARLVRISPDIIPLTVEGPADKAGIVFPVYADGLPRIVEAFARGLDLPLGTYAFAVANYGGSSGGSLLQMDNIFKGKEVPLSAAFGFKMPDNTQILFPPCSKAEQEEDFRREEESVRTIAGIIQSKAAARDDLDLTRRRLGTMWARPPFDPRGMAKEFRADGKCNGCGLCEKICPVENVAMKDGRPVWLNRCEQCVACMQWCPKEAIQFGDKTTGWGRYHHPAITAKELFRQKEE
jgi:ferredoxin